MLAIAENAGTGSVSLQHLPHSKAVWYHATMEVQWWYNAMLSPFHHVTIAGSVQFINNSASQGGAIVSDGNVTVADNAQVVFQCNRAKTSTIWQAQWSFIVLPCNMANYYSRKCSSGFSRQPCRWCHCLLNHVIIAGAVQHNNSAEEVPLFLMAM